MILTSPYSGSRTPNPDLSMAQVNKLKEVFTGIFGDQVSFTVQHYGEEKELLMYVSDINKRTVFWKYLGLVDFKNLSSCGQI